MVSALLDTHTFWVNKTGEDSLDNHGHYEVELPNIVVHILATAYNANIFHATVKAQQVFFSQRQQCKYSYETLLSNLGFPLLRPNLLSVLRLLVLRIVL